MSVEKEVQDIKSQMESKKFQQKLSKMLMSKVFETVLTFVLISIVVLSGIIIETGGNLDQIIKNYEWGSVGLITFIIFLSKEMTMRLARIRGIEKAEIDVPEIDSMKLEIADVYTSLDKRAAGKILYEEARDTKKLIIERMRQDEKDRYIEILANIPDVESKKYKKYTKLLKECDEKVYKEKKWFEFWKTKYKATKLSDLCRTGNSRYIDNDSRIFNHSTVKYVKKQGRTMNVLSVVITALFGSVGIGALLQNADVLQIVLMFLGIAVLIGFSFLSTYRLSYKIHASDHLLATRERLKKLNELKHITESDLKGDFSNVTE